jgi:hypothetical protein
MIGCYNTFIYAVTLFTTSNSICVSCYKTRSMATAEEKFLKVKIHILVLRIV